MITFNEKVNTHFYLKGVIKYISVAYTGTGGLWHDCRIECGKNKRYQMIIKKHKSNEVHEFLGKQVECHGTIDCDDGNVVFVIDGIGEV